MVQLLPTIDVRLADGTLCVVNESDFDMSIHSRVDDAAREVRDDADQPAKRRTRK